MPTRLARLFQTDQLIIPPMAPLTASTTFATLVGLIINFKTERSAGQSARREDFIAYLEQHRYDELRDEISRTYALSELVDSYMKAVKAGQLGAAS
jgi:hypothetical protein